MDYLDKDDIWRRAEPLLRESVGDVTYNSWFSRLKPYSCNSTEYVLDCGSESDAPLVENLIRRHLPAIQQAFDSFLPIKLNIRLQVSNQTKPVSVVEDSAHAISSFPSQTPPHSKYTFDNFVVGPSNNFAASACKNVAKYLDASTSNPIFIYGDSGLGKTHLMHAICNYVLIHHPDRVAVLVNCESFVNEFIQTIQNNTYQSFRQKYRSCNVLIIDDIQFLASKMATQEEFFNTFNTLIENGCNIIMTSDKSPLAVDHIDARLKSRFQSGLTCDIQPPTSEMRIAILQKIAQTRNWKVSDEIIYYIASKFTKNIRELEGALNTVVMLGSVVSDLNMTEVKKALAPLINQEAPQKVGPEAIIDMVASYFQVTVSDIVGKNRSSQYVLPRQICMYLLSKESNLTFQMIGKHLNRHHSTCMHGVEAIADGLTNHDSEIENAISNLVPRISGQKAGS